MTDQRKPIGPAFIDDLLAYGTAHGIQLVGAAFAWHADGMLDFPVDAPDELVTAVTAVYAAHDPARGSATLNAVTRDGLLSQASVSLMPLQTAISLGIATTAETAQAKAWLVYTRDVKAVDLTQRNPVWPTPPQ